MAINAASLIMSVSADTSSAERSLATLQNKASSSFNNISGSARGVSTSIGNMFDVAGGVAFASAMSAASNAIGDLMNTARDAYAFTERLGLSLQNMAGREMVNAGMIGSMAELREVPELMAMATGRASELQGWMEKLAVESPFNYEDVATSMRLSMAYGFTSTEAQRLTETLSDFSAGSGQTGFAMKRIALALGQIKSRGKVASQELNQLSEVGINARQILAEHFGVSLPTMVKNIEKGLVPANEAVEAITQSLERDFGGAALSQMNTISGLTASLEDLKQFTARDLFAGVFQSMQPFAAELVATLTDPEVKAQIKQIGLDIGVHISGALATAKDAALDFYNEFQRVGGGVIGVISGITAALQIPQWMSGIASFIGAWLLLTPTLSGIANLIIGVGAKLSAVFAMLLNPVGMVAAALIGFYFAWETNFMGMRDAMAPVIQGIMNIGSAIGMVADMLATGIYSDAQMKGLTEMFGPEAATGIILFADYLRGMVVEVGNFVAEIVSVTGPVASAWNISFSRIRDVVTKSWDVMRPVFMDWSKWLITEIPKGVQRLQSIITRASVIFSKFFNSKDIAKFQNRISEIAVDISRSFSDLFDGKLSFGDFGQQLQDALAAIPEAVADLFGGVDFSNMVTAFQWESFIPTLSWDGVVGSFEWGNFIAEVDLDQKAISLEWGNFVAEVNLTQKAASLEWGNFVAQLNWGDRVASLTWGNFLVNLDWNTKVFTLGWGDYVFKLDWKTFVANLTAWGVYVTRLDWGGYITKLLSWAAWIPRITWASFIGFLTLSSYVTSLIWSEFISKINWTGIVTAFGEWASYITDFGAWSAYISKVDWLMHINKLADWLPFVPKVDWGIYVGKLTWGDFVVKIDWLNYLTTISWGDYVLKLDWKQIGLAVIDWAMWIPALVWTVLITPVRWGAWIASLVWNTIIDPVFWTNFIPTIASWSQYISKIDWALFFNPIAWGLYISSIDWNKYLPVKFAWNSFVTKVDWFAHIKPFTWPTFNAPNWTEFIDNLVWPTFTPPSWGDYIPDLKWPDIPKFPGWAEIAAAFGFGGGAAAASGGGGQNPATQPGSGISTDKGLEIFGWDVPGLAKGTDSWRGGLTWVGEQGPELLDLPKGARIFNNKDSVRLAESLMEMSKSDKSWVDVGFNADGTTPLPPLPPTKNLRYQAASTGPRPPMGPTINPADITGPIVAAGESAMQNIESGWLGQTASFVDSTTTAMEGAAAAAADAFESAAKNTTDAFKSALESALRDTPGLFGVSQVTDDQMKLAEMGVPQNFADNWLRRLTDEVMNGVDWEGVDIKDAAKRGGIDPNLPNEVILEMVKQMWADSSLFADPKNLELIDMQAVGDTIAKQAAAQAGQANIMSLFGLGPDGKDAQAQAAQAATSMLNGFAATLQSGAMESVGQQTMIGLANGMGNITPEATTALTNAMSGQMSVVGDIGQQEIASNLANNIGTAIGDAVAQSGTADNFTGALSQEMSSQSSMEFLKGVGAQIAEYIFIGYKKAAQEMPWASGVPANGNAGDGAGTSAVAPPTGASLPQNANGTPYWAGGYTIVGEEGPELVRLPSASRIWSTNETNAMLRGSGGASDPVVIEQVHIHNGMDVAQLEYRIRSAQRRRGKR